MNKSIEIAILNNSNLKYSLKENAKISDVTILGCLIVFSVLVFTILYQNIKNPSSEVVKIPIHKGLEKITQNPPFIITDSKHINSKLSNIYSSGELFSKPLLFESLNFEADSFRVTKEVYPELNEIIKFLISNTDLGIEIIGHTNGIPEHRYSDELSTKRAKSIAGYFIENGISKDNVKYLGMGKRSPIMSNSTKEGRRINQRVEFKFFRGTLKN